MKTRRLPNLLIVGGQKCGTSWLHAMLNQHPDIFMSKVKELFFFSHPNKIPDIVSYLKNFDVEADYKYIGESSTSYMWTYDEQSAYKSIIKNRNIPDTVKDYLGENVRIIISERHPVARAISAFYHHFRKGRIDPNTSICDYLQHYGLIEFGFFSRHIGNWKNVYGDRVHTVYFDRIKHEPGILLDDVTNFLNLPAFEFSGLSKKKNEGSGLVLNNGYIEAGGKSDDNTPKINLEDVERLFDIYKNEITIFHNKYMDPAILDPIKILNF